MAFSNPAQPWVMTFIIPFKPQCCSGPPIHTPAPTFMLTNLLQCSTTLDLYSKNRLPQSTNSSMMMKHSSQRKPKVDGITAKATPKATPSPFGMRQRRQRVRRTGMTTQATRLSLTPSPTGTAMVPMWDRVAGVMMSTPRYSWMDRDRRDLIEIPDSPGSIKSGESRPTMLNFYTFLLLWFLFSL